MKLLFLKYWYDFVHTIKKHNAIKLYLGVNAIKQIDMFSL